MRFFAIITMHQQKRTNKPATCSSSRKRIKLRAVTNFSKQYFGPVGPYSKQRDTALGGTQKTCHQVHQGRFTCTIGSNQTGNTGRNREVHSIDSEYVAIKLGDIVEDD